MAELIDGKVVLTEDEFRANGERYNDLLARYDALFDSLAEEKARRQKEWDVSCDVALKLAELLAAAKPLANFIGHWADLSDHETISVRVDALRGLAAAVARAEGRS